MAFTQITFPAPFFAQSQPVGFETKLDKPEARKSSVPLCPYSLCQVVLSLIFFTTVPNTNDIITLYNGSANPVVIHSIDIFRGKKRNAVKPIYLGFEDEFWLISLAPKTTYNINISEEYKFKLKEGENLYLFLHVIGLRKTIKLKVHFN